LIQPCASKGSRLRQLAAQTGALNNMFRRGFGEGRTQRFTGARVLSQMFPDATLPVPEESKAVELP
jgi:hypothetical protein